MWPRFQSPPGDHLEVAQVVERGTSAIKAPAGLAMAAMGIVGLVVAVVIRNRVMTEPESWRRFLPAFLLFAFLGAGFAVAWAWHAVTVPRWWDWAVATGVDTDELIAAELEGGLLSSQESWWRERPSTIRARRRQGAHQAL